MPEPLPPPQQPESWPRRMGWFILGYLGLLVICIPVFLILQPRSVWTWIAALVLVPPAYLALEWAGGKLAEPWGERTSLQKFAKAGCIVLGYLALVAVWLIFGPAVCPGRG